MAFLRVAARVMAAMAAALPGLAVPATATAAAGPGPVTVALGSLAPALPGPADTLTVTGRLAGASAGPVDGAQLELRVNGGAVVAGSATPVAALGPGAGESFRLTVPVAALKLGGPGSYRLTVELTGGGRVLGAADTVLPWAPSGSPQPPKVSVVWPLTDTPHMEAVALGGGDAAQPVFRDDALAAELASGGRLTALVAAASGLPVTWTADPALLDEARAMAGGYRVANTPDTANPQDSRPGDGGHAAASWLAALRTAVRGGQVLQLPYGDPDLAALGRQGAGRGVLGTVLGEAARLGAAATTGALGPSTAPPTPTAGPTPTPTSTSTASASAPAATPQNGPVAWPAQGAADASFTALAQQLGYRALPPGDPAIGAVLARPMTDASDVLAARQQILADLLGDARTGSGPLVVVPPRRMSAPAAQALGQALRAALAAGRIQGVPLTPGGATASAGDPSGGPAPAVLATLRGIQPRLDTLSQVLSEPARTTAAVHRAMLRALSTGWRADPAGEQAYARGVAAYVDASIASVRLLPKSGTVTMPGTSASVPVTIANGLQQPLAGLELRVTTGSPGRVTVDTPRSGVTAPAAANRTQQVRISAHHEGPVRLVAQLYTVADGRPWGAPVSFQVDVTSLPQGTVTMVAGAVLLVLLAALVKVRLARRRAGV